MLVESQSADLGLASELLGKYRPVRRQRTFEASSCQCWCETYFFLCEKIQVRSAFQECGMLTVALAAASTAVSAVRMGHPKLVRLHTCPLLSIRVYLSSASPPLPGSQSLEARYPLSPHPQTRMCFIHAVVLIAASHPNQHWWSDRSLHPCHAIHRA